MEDNTTSQKSKQQNKKPSKKPIAAYTLKAFFDNPDQFYELSVKEAKALLLATSSHNSHGITTETLIKSGLKRSQAYLYTAKAAKIDAKAYREQPKTSLPLGDFLEVVTHGGYRGPRDTATKALFLDLQIARLGADHIINLETLTDRLKITLKELRELLKYTAFTVDYQPKIGKIKRLNGHGGLFKNGKPISAKAKARAAAKVEAAADETAISLKELDQRERGKAATADKPKNQTKNPGLWGKEHLAECKELAESIQSGINGPGINYGIIPADLVALAAGKVTEGEYIHYRDKKERADADYIAAEAKKAAEAKEWKEKHPEPELSAERKEQIAQDTAEIANQFFPGLFDDTLNSNQKNEPQAATVAKQAESEQSHSQEQKAEKQAQEAQIKPELVSADSSYFDEPPLDDEYLAYSCGNESGQRWQLPETEPEPVTVAPATPKTEKPHQVYVIKSWREYFKDKPAQNGGNLTDSFEAILRAYSGQPEIVQAAEKALTWQAEQEQQADQRWQYMKAKYNIGGGNV